MFDERRRRGLRDPALARHGDTAAWGLCDRCGGDPEKGTGWRGALQAAADDSDQDPEVLHLADEIYAMAHLMTTAAAIFAFADAARTVVRDPPADLFLLGMLAHVEQRTRRS